MKGLLTLAPTDQIAGKKSEFKTVEAFCKACLEEYLRAVHPRSVELAFMRYYPKGTEDSEGEFGKGVGVYQCVDKPSRGTFEIFLTSHPYNSDFSDAAKNICAYSLYAYDSGFNVVCKVCPLREACVEFEGVYDLKELIRLQQAVNKAAENVKE